MGRDEDVTVELPVVEIDTPPDRVYVPPKTIPPKTKVATIELETVQVRQEPGSRQTPTIRVRRGCSTAVPSGEVPTDRPGQVWKHDSDIPPPCPVSASALDPSDAVTRRLERPPVGAAVPDSDPREAATQPPARDPREAATLSPSELRAMGVAPLVMPALESGEAVTPRPDSRITDEELEAIQSARTLEVPQAPQLASSATDGRRRAPLALVIGGVLLGVVIVWVAVLVGRGTRLESAPVAVGTASVSPPASPSAAGHASRLPTAAPAEASAVASPSEAELTPAVRPSPGLEPGPAVEFASAEEAPVHVATDPPAAAPSRPPPLATAPAHVSEQTSPASSAAPQRSRAIY